MHWFRRKKILTVQNRRETINRSYFENYFPFWEKPLISSPSPKFESFLIFCCHRLVTCFASHFIKRVKRLIGFVRPVKENRYPQLFHKPGKILFLSILLRYLLLIVVCSTLWSHSTTKYYFHHLMKEIGKN